MATIISSVPFTITKPGTYLLGGDFLDGDSSKNAITVDVSAGDVTIDLGGFTLSGWRRGVLSDSGPNSVTVKNGKITDTSSHAVLIAYGGEVMNVYVDSLDTARTGPGIAVYGAANLVCVENCSNAQYTTYGGVISYGFGEGYEIKSTIIKGCKMSDSTGPDSGSGTYNPGFCIYNVNSVIVDDVEIASNLVGFDIGQEDGYSSGPVTYSVNNVRLSDIKRQTTFIAGFDGAVIKNVNVTCNPTFMVDSQPIGASVQGPFQCAVIQRGSNLLMEDCSFSGCNAFARSADDRSTGRAVLGINTLKNAVIRNVNVVGGNLKQEAESTSYDGNAAMRCVADLINIAFIDCVFDNGYVGYEFIPLPEAEIKRVRICGGSVSGNASDAFRFGPGVTHGSDKFLFFCDEKEPDVIVCKDVVQLFNNNGDFTPYVAGGVSATATATTNSSSALRDEELTGARHFRRNKKEQAEEQAEE